MCALAPKKSSVLVFYGNGKGDKYVAGSYQSHNYTAGIVLDLEGEYFNGIRKEYPYCCIDLRDFGRKKTHIQSEMQSQRASED